MPHPRSESSTLHLSMAPLLHLFRSPLLACLRIYSGQLVTRCLLETLGSASSILVSDAARLPALDSGSLWQDLVLVGISLGPPKEVEVAGRKKTLRIKVDNTLESK